MHANNVLLKVTVLVSWPKGKKKSGCKSYSENVFEAEERLFRSISWGGIFCSPSHQYTEVYLRKKECLTGMLMGETSNPRTSCWDFKPHHLKGKAWDAWPANDNSCGISTFIVPIFTLPFIKYITYINESTYREVAALHTVIGFGSLLELNNIII